MTYSLILTDPTGAEITGTLDVELANSSGNGSLTDLVVQPNEETKVSVIPIKGSLMIGADTPIDMQGVCYCSVMGPPIAYILTGESAGSSYVGVQFNLIDSAGQHIGGGVQWDDKPYGLIGQQ